VKQISSKDQIIGGLICVACVATAIGYSIALFWPALEAIRLWLVAIPVFIAFVAILAIGAWIGWTMASTPPPGPIENIQQPETNQQEKEREADLTTS